MWFRGGSEGGGGNLVGKKPSELRLKTVGWNGWGENVGTKFLVYDL